MQFVDGLARCARNMTRSASSITRSSSGTVKSLSSQVMFTNLMMIGLE